MKIAYIIYGVCLTIMVMAFLSPQPSSAAETDVENFTSTATVNKQVAIGISAELTNGVAFGSLDAGSNNNADAHNGEDNAVTADASNNIGIDLCIRANANLSVDDDTAIPMVNYTWWTNSSAAVLNNETTMSTTYQKTFQANVAANGVIYFGFWVDIPPAKDAGAYNNTLQIKAVETGEACGT